MPEATEKPPVRIKANYVGAPKIFLLEQACQQVVSAFDSFGCFLVGSAIERPDWRDVDVRMIMSDEMFKATFPDACIKASALWEFDPRWLLLTTSISEWMSQRTGLPIDFQIQPATQANKWHPGHRHAIGLRVGKRED
jgi:hypothetical protein